MAASLAWLLHPINVEMFLKKVWATTHLHIQRHCPSYFDGLFGAAAVEEFLEFRRPDTPSVAWCGETRPTTPPATVLLVAILTSFEFAMSSPTAIRSF